MTVTIKLPSDIEAVLIAQARDHGLDLPQYLERLLRGQVAPQAGAVLSPAERAAAWRVSSRGLPATPPLSDEAISRDSIYGYKTCPRSGTWRRAPRRITDLDFRLLSLWSKWRRSNGI